MSSFCSSVSTLLLSQSLFQWNAFASPPSCDSLASLVSSSSPLTITNASIAPAGSLNFSEVDSSNAITVCRIQGTVGYGSNGTIGIELWLPSSDQWNGKYMAVGNGGLAGVIDYEALMIQVNTNYAVAAGDSGHLLSNNGNGTTASGQAIPFLQDLQQTVEWIHDSMAAITPPTRDVVASYYGTAPSYSYYVGCSTGGAQGFALAQYHPHLFDGIVAGSPGNWYSHLILSFLWNYLHSRNESFLSQETLYFINNKTLDACDELDGVKDRLIENPLACTFDITSLACAANQTTIVDDKTQCLTAQQIATAQAFYSGPRSGETQIYPGFSIGSESSWTFQETFLATDYSFPILQNLVFKDLSYDVSTFNFDTDVAHVNATASPYIDSISPDLSPFKARGGKMVVTQGWSDPFNAATWPIEDLDRIDAFLGLNGLGSASEFLKLFMVPGGGHCGAAPAYPHVPANWHSLDALVPWVEKGMAPTQMLSTEPADGSNTTRKLCAWPTQAHLASGGDFDNWEDWMCS